MLKDAKCHLILGNTYHLGNQPGAETVDALGGLHEFTGWDRAMLTDSGAPLHCMLACVTGGEGCRIGMSRRDAVA